ncbi:MAG: VCBS repeat-containing protein, partial [Anaerolineales bacterium]|nr:VCBS repeat-containing protein [Anaerolineales bacterium]
MQIYSSRKLIYGLLIFFLGVMGILLITGNKAASADTQAIHAEWTYLLPGLADASDPVIADVNGDGKLDIVAATHNGHVVAVDRNGNLLWDRDISPYYGLSNNQQRILAAPAVADLDNNGMVEIVVATGTADSTICYPGGVIVLKNNGEISSGNWPFLTRDGSTLPANCPDGVYGTPAIDDMDGDGDKEIIFGGFDKGLYILNHDGTTVAGFPIDSALRYRFPAWQDLMGHLADTIWSSPAIADLDGDGTKEIIIGTDEGHFGDSYGGNGLGWYCPYPNTLGAEYCGGTLYAVNHDSQL